VCASAECKSLLNGKLFACPRAAHGYELGITEGETFVDLINTPKKELKKAIKELYSLPYLKTCDHCTPEWDREEMETAKQM